jgi:hypothetical protein
MVSQVVPTSDNELSGVSSLPQNAGDLRLQLDPVNLKVNTPIHKTILFQRAGKEK